MEKFGGGRKDRIGVLVLGMHRSGTSALSRVLSLLGCDLPNTLMGASRSNESGHWESSIIYRLNDEILGSGGSDWQDWLAFNPGWYSSPKFAEYKERALTTLEEEFGDSRLFVLKDPRICRLAPFWLDVLETAGARPAVVIPVRNPLEVAQSLALRDGFDPALGHLLWLRHVLEAEVGTRGLRRFYCSYDDLLTGWSRVVAAAQEALDVPWPRYSTMVSEEIDGFLKDHLRHHRESSKNATDNPLLSAWVREVFAIVDRWSNEGERAEDYAALDRIRTEFDGAAPAFARLISSGRQSAAKAKALDASLKEAKGKLAEAESAVLAQRQVVEGQEKQLEDAGAALALTKAAAVAKDTEIAEIAERLAGARADLAGLQEEAASLQAALKVAREEVSQSQSALTQRSAEAEEVVTKLREAEAAALAHRQVAQGLEKQLGEARAALSSFQEAAVGKDAEIAETAERLAAARAEYAKLQDEADSLGAALKEAQGQLSQAQSALAQRSAEADEVTAQLRDTERRLAEELEAERARTAARSDEIAALTRALQEKQEEAAAAIERERAEKDATERRLSGELEAERACTAVRVDEIVALTRILKEKQEEAAAAIERERAEKDATDRRLSGELEAERARTAARVDEIAALTRTLKEKQEEAAAAIERERTEKVAVEGRLAERFSEIAVMTRLLGEKDDAARLSNEKAAWMRNVSAVLMNGTGPGLMGRLAALLPAPMHLKRQKKILKRNGLFDPDAYLAIHPEIAAAGMDPLWHYINFGMDEGRQLQSTQPPGGQGEHEKV
jgi:hypothetical protein